MLVSRFCKQGRQAWCSYNGQGVVAKMGCSGALEVHIREELTFVGFILAAHSLYERFDLGDMENWLSTVADG